MSDDARAGGAAPASKHGAKVPVPPPLLFAAGFLAGVGMRRIVPGDVLPEVLAAPALFVGWLLAGAGVALAISGIATFFAARTTIIPHRAVSNLVAHGPYRFTRNPMYVGLCAAYAGLALVLDRLWPFAFLPFVLLAIVTIVIRPEERYLESRFGEEYRDYKRRVRRFV